MIRLILSTAVALLATVGSVLADDQPLTFDAKSVGGPNSGASFELWRPAGPGPFPAMLVLHGCGGVGANQRSWAARLNGWGYVAVVLDSFRPRNVKSVCNVGGIAPRLRAQDAFNAAIYLRTLPDIQADRIGTIGFSHGGSTVLETVLERAVPVDRGGKPFRVGVAYYPGCGANPPFQQPATDLLILIGKDDDWSSAVNCQKMVAGKAGMTHAPSIKVYPGAVHGFDGGGLPTWSHDHMVGGNAEAAADSFVMTQTFLEAHLKAR